MLHTSPAKILKKRWKLVALSGVVLSVLSLIVSLLLPLEYRADAQLLIIPRSQYGVDPYTSVKSAERIGENIAQVIKTDDFYTKVVANPGYSLDTSRFRGVSERTKRKRWQKTVDAAVVFGTGVVNISAYHTSAVQARQFAGAVADTAVSHGAEYVGSDVVIKVVNRPVATSIPVRPNLLVNAFLGFVVGVLLMGLAVLRKYRRIAMR